MKQKLRNGETIIAENKQDKLLKKLYTNVFGRFFVKIVSFPVFSKMAGFYLSTKLSCRMIKSFIEKNNIDMSLFEDVEYKNYNEFFSRKIKKDKRPIDYNPDAFISPCDSKLTVLKISSDTLFTLKHTTYSVSSLLKNEALAKEYDGGYVLIFRLTVDDYHRYCYTDNGKKEKNTFIKGKLHTVNPIANDYYPIYKENSRSYSILHSENFGDIITMEVGALLVGKIVNHHEEAEVKRGEEKGFFKFGGSTVVLMVKKDTVKIDEDILKNSEEDFETVVKYGEKIGKACAKQI